MLRMRRTNQVQKERQVSEAPALWQVEAKVNGQSHSRTIWVIATSAVRAMGCVRQTYSEKEPEFLSVQKRNKFGEIMIDIEAADELFQQYKQAKEDPFE